MRFSFLEGEHGSHINGLFSDFLEEVDNKNLGKCDLKIDKFLKESNNCIAFNVDMVHNDLIEEGWSDGDLLFFFVRNAMLRYCKLKNDYLFKFYTEKITLDYFKYKCKIKKIEISCIKQIVSS